MNRRNFLKALGLGSTVSAASACGLDNNRYYTPIEQILPYVVRPEQVTPGTPTFFATTVLSGPDAYPQLARHREGRVTNVGANPAAPAPRAVSAHALFELQRHFNPDRLRSPTSGGSAVAWEQGLQQLAEAVRAAQSAGKKVAYVGPYTHGAAEDLLTEFTGGDAIFWSPMGLDAEARAADLLFGSPALPRYDIANARYVLSFGAEFLGGGWGGNWSQSAYAAARDPNVGGFVARFALVSPFRGQAGANADDWFAVAPGSEAQVALALAKLVAQRKGYSGPGASLVSSGDPAKAAAAAGLDVSDLEQIASIFAAAPSIALPGGVTGASAAATELAAAVYLLNVVSGSSLFQTGGYAGAIHGVDRLEQLVADMKAGRVGVLLVNDVNPHHDLPRDLGFAEAMGSVDLTIAVTSHPSETTAACKLVLPTSDMFEDWGDEEPVQGLRLLRQPAQTPLYDTRSLGDVILATWRAVDASTAPQGTWRDYLMRRWAVLFGKTRQAGLVPSDATEAVTTETETETADTSATAAFLRWWEERLAAGFYEDPEASPPTTPQVTGAVAFSEATGLIGSGAYDLVVFPHPHVLDGRYANAPWAHEVSEPLTGTVWDNFAMVHPETAATLGVKDGELLAITSDVGTIQLGVEIQPLIRVGAVAVALGFGHSAAAGRYAEIVGKNVVELLSFAKDKYGAVGWQQKKVDLKSAGPVSGLVTLKGHDTDNHRHFAVTVSAEKLAHVGDQGTAHPGELTGIHHLPMDRRLQKEGITDFFPIPDHPTYRFGMTIDTNACTGCSACSVACYAENNLPVIGRDSLAKGRTMSWIRIGRYFEDDGIYFVPMLCQQCGHAPCESVCPVLATYHSIDGLNAMVYNRCVGTRYCANACPYSVRRFNYHSYSWPEPFNLQLNPDVTVRTMGVMEKCSFCVQRIRETKSAYRDRGFTQTVPEEALEQLPACAEACPSQAIRFGNLNNDESIPARTRKSARTYFPLAEINTFPAINYLAKANFHHDPTAVHHAAAEDHGGGAEHGTAPEAHGEEAH